MLKPICALFISTALFAQLDIGEIVEKKEFHSYTINEAKDSHMISDYAFMTGDTEGRFNEYLSQAVLDASWQKAQNAFFREFRSMPKPPQGIPMEIIEGRATANWIDALKYLGDFVQRTRNPVGAYQGVSIIANYVLVFYPDKNVQKEFFDEVVGKYMPLFADILYENKFCYGAYMKLLFDWEYSDNKYSAINNVKEGEAICASQMAQGSIPPFVDRDFRVLFAKAKINTEMRNQNAK
jgi:hypothetical protein